MKLEESVLLRLEDLITKGSGLEYYDEMHSSNRQTAFDCKQWLTSAANILDVIFPDPESSYQRSSRSSSGGLGYRVGMMRAVLMAAREDIKAGVIGSVVNAARAQTFDDFIDHAEHYLQGSKVPQAGVIAGVVFEDAVRRLCDKLGVGTKGAKLDQLISDLEKNATLTPVKAKRARAAADVRTRATHADWEKFEAADVASTITLARELIEKLEG